MELITLIIVWVMSCAASAAAGVGLCKKRGNRSVLKTPTKEELLFAEQQRREFENSMTYTGRPQAPDKK